MRMVRCVCKLLYSCASVSASYIHSHSVVTIGFNRTAYSLSEDMSSAIVTLSVQNGTLDRDVIVTLSTINGTAIRESPKPQEANKSPLTLSTSHFSSWGRVHTYIYQCQFQCQYINSNSGHSHS